MKRVEEWIACSWYNLQKLENVHRVYLVQQA